MALLTQPIPFWLWLLMLAGASLWAYAAILAHRRAIHWQAQARYIADYWLAEASRWREKYARLHNLIARDPQFWEIIDREGEADDATH